MHEEEDQGFMLLLLGVLAAVLIAGLWYVAGSDDGATSEIEAVRVTAEDGSAEEGSADPAEDPESAGSAGEDSVDETADPIIKPLRLSVIATGERLTLTGTIDTAERGALLSAQAASLVGADNVDNQLEVAPDVSLAAGLDISVSGYVPTEELAIDIRDLIGIGSGIEVAVNDDLVVDPTSAAPDSLADADADGQADTATDDTATDDTATDDTTDGEESTSDATSQSSVDVAARLKRVFAFTPIRFASGSSTIDAESTTALDEGAVALLENPGTTVLVEGHTDNQGDADANQRLSAARAEAVVAYLESAGVPDGQLEARGFGDTQPIADNGTPEGRAENRRIDFTPFTG